MPVSGGGLDVLASSAALAEDALVVGSVVVVTTSTPLKRPISTIGVVAEQQTPKVFVTRHRHGECESAAKIHVVPKVPKEGHVRQAFNETEFCEREHAHLLQELAGKETFIMICIVRNTPCWCGHACSTRL